MTDNARTMTTSVGSSTSRPSPTILGVGARYIRRLVQERRVPFIKLGHYIRFDLREIWPWLDGFRRPQLRPARLPGRNV